MLQLWLLVMVTRGDAITGKDSTSEEVLQPMFAPSIEMVVPVVMIDDKDVAPVAPATPATLTASVSTTDYSDETPRAYESDPADQCPSCSTNYAYTIPEYFPISNQGYLIVPSYGQGGYPTVPLYGQGGYPTDPSYGQGGYSVAPSYGGYQSVYAPTQSYMTPYARNLLQSPVYNVLVHYPNRKSPYFHIGPLKPIN